jgi:hypothetical protein
VALVVVQSGDPTNPTGFVVLDSQGGHYIMDGAGNPLDDDTANSILNDAGGSSETVYPFWTGLDIGRDMELHPLGAATSGVAIYDGWGGVHPVPVDPGAAAVSFLRNDGPISPVGLPYIQVGFDNPDTAADEADTSTYGVDSNSIFKDIEFCSSQVFGAQGLYGDGVYVLDAFGAVFAFGSTRSAPNDLQPLVTGGPYFFPNLYAQDMEADSVETAAGPGK